MRRSAAFNGVGPPGSPSAGSVTATCAYHNIVQESRASASAWRATPLGISFLVARGLDDGFVRCGHYTLTNHGIEPDD